MKRWFGLFGEKASPEKGAPVDGLAFSRVPGAGTIRCESCNHSEKIVGFIHNRESSTKGYQCRACGKFEARTFRKPFAEGSVEDRIEVALSTVKRLESWMQARPKRQWLPGWEPMLAASKVELNEVTDRDVAAVLSARKHAEAEYAMTLFCDCGGALECEEILRCPKCKGKKLEYDVEFMT